MVYKMSRGNNHISKYVFWIDETEVNKDSYKIDTDVENIMDEDKGMRFFK